MHSYLSITPENVDLRQKHWEKPFSYWFGQCDQKDIGHKSQKTDKWDDTEPKAPHSKIKNGENKQDGRRCFQSTYLIKGQHPRNEETKFSIEKTDKLTLKLDEGCMWTPVPRCGQEVCGGCSDCWSLGTCKLSPYTLQCVVIISLSSSVSSVLKV